MQGFLAAIAGDNFSRLRIENKRPGRAGKSHQKVEDSVLKRLMQVRATDLVFFHESFTLAPGGVAAEGFGRFHAGRKPQKKGGLMKKKSGLYFGFFGGTGDLCCFRGDDRPACSLGAAGKGAFSLPC